MKCNRCEGTGFLNLHLVDYATQERFGATGDVGVILRWITENSSRDVALCDCCSDGNDWYGEPGQHNPNNPQDPMGCR